MHRDVTIAVALAELSRALVSSAPRRRSTDTIPGGMLSLFPRRAQMLKCAARTHLGLQAAHVPSRRAVPVAMLVALMLGGCAVSTQRPPVSRPLPTAAETSPPTAKPAAAATNTQSLPTGVPTATVAVRVMSTPTAFGPAVPTPTGPASGVIVVQLGDHYYMPAELSVPVGTRVEWRNQGSQTHDVTAFDGSFRSPTLGVSASFSHTFSDSGTYPYLCTPHAGDGMMGKVVVK
jgi:plastocyanin